MTDVFGFTGLALLLIAGVMAYVEFRREDVREGIIYTSLSMLGFCMLLGCAALRDKPAVAATPATEAPADPRGTASQQALFIVRGQEAVQTKLRDPASATFRGQFYSRSGGMHITCGSVNSKNGFGGYIGYQRYISNSLPDTTYLEQEVADFNVAWQQLCRG